ncbi:MAG: hypothetical protein OYG31_01875 [Candidatus Kaiserbacteria bacterium]|nr:hypothetical protein [Candidatus Kaiserbacteria bacterium]
MKDTIVTTKRDNEGSMLMYRRFVKKFRSSGVQTLTKKRRFQARKPSKSIRRKDCIARITKHSIFERAYRLGKISPSGKRGGY